MEEAPVPSPPYLPPCAANLDVGFSNLETPGNPSRVSQILKVGFLGFRMTRSPLSAGVSHRRLTHTVRCPKAQRIIKARMKSDQLDPEDVEDDRDDDDEEPPTCNWLTSNTGATLGQQSLQ